MNDLETHEALLSIIKLLDERLVITNKRIELLQRRVKALEAKS